MLYTQEFFFMLKTCFQDNEKILNHYDSIVGDGDHGTNMLKGFDAVINNMPITENNVGILFKKAGNIFLHYNDGASGFLFGNAFIDVGDEIKDFNIIDFKILVRSFERALLSIKKHGQSQLGDNTIIDALEPATVSLRNSYIYGSSLEISMPLAIAEATKGMRSTKSSKTKFCPDPGAVSCSLILETLNEFISEKDE